MKCLYIPNESLFGVQHDQVTYVFQSTADDAVTVNGVRYREMFTEFL